MMALSKKRNRESGREMRKILVVIDMQNDFIDGALGTKEAEAIVDNVVAKIKDYPKEDVYATQDTHEEDYLLTQEGKNLPVEHCIRGTKGWEIRPEIARLLESDHIYEKPTFGSVALAEQLKRIAFEDLERENLSDSSDSAGIEIELVGLCTDICVVSNALLLKAEMPEIKISVDPACCAGVTPEKHAAALATMESCQIQIK